MVRKKSPHIILGVDEDADEKTIRKAYRKKAKELHPDRNNGDREKEKAMIDLNYAYKLLTDPEAFARFKATGDRPEYDSIDREALRILNDLASSFIDHMIDGDAFRPSYVNPVEKIEKKMTESISEFESKISSSEKRIKKLEKLSEKLKKGFKKAPQINLFLTNVKTRIDALNNEILYFRKQIEIIRRILTFLTEYEYFNEDDKKAADEYVNVGNRLLEKIGAKGLFEFNSETGWK